MVVFVVQRAEHAEAGVPAAGVVEAFDVPEEPESGLLSSREALAPQQLLGEAGEERLGDGVVPRSRTVVRGPPRLPSAPRRPSWRISRATRFLPTAIPSPSRSSEWIRGAP